MEEQVKYKAKKWPKYKPLKVGQKFGRLTVLGLHHVLPYKRKNGIIENRECYLCKCDCGKEIVTLKNSLRTGNTKSCGCLSAEKASIFCKSTKKTHGLTKSRIYGVWSALKRRCYYKKDNRYYCYGGRGISVCEEWKNNFMAFYNWAISNGYRVGLTIDRINVNGNYEPSNCRWITKKEQNLNRRTNRIIEYKGERHCVTEWADIMGLDSKKFYYRITHGYSFEDACNI